MLACRTVLRPPMLTSAQSDPENGIQQGEGVLPPRSPSPLPANLDAVRGLACVLLVAYHVVGGSADNGLKLADEHGARLLMEWLAYIRMPVFVALSGYLFAGRPPTKAALRRFAVGKLRRLGIPLIVATAVYMLLRWAVYGIALDPLAFLSSYQHLWFLHASLLLFAAFGLWAAFGRQSWSALLAVVPLAGIAADLLPWVQLFSIGGAVSLAPFFAFGIVARRHGRIVTSPASIAIAAVTVASLMRLSAAHLLGAAGEIPRTGLALALCGCGWFALFLRFVPPTRILGMVGLYSYAIFLWHPLFGAAARMTAQGVGLQTNTGLALVSFAAALGAPVLLHRLVEPWPLSALLLLGLRRSEPAGRVRLAASSVQVEAAR